MKEIFLNEGFILLLIMVLYLSKYPEVFKNLSTRSTAKYGLIQLSDAGYPVRSTGERKISEWLYEHNIPHKYEPKLMGMRPDFWIPQAKTVIEYWGMAMTENSDGEKYRDKMAKKRQKYHASNITLIDVLPADISNLDKLLAPLLATPKIPHSL